MALFQPGQSGNPGGRPKVDPEIREAARAHAEQALKVFIDGLTDDDARVRLKSAEHLLDRAYGKPALSIDAEIRGTLTGLLAGMGAGQSNNT